MATLRMDMLNGNDANNGSSFALRFKTFNSGATAARTAPGDEIWIMESEQPATLGINVTWTNQSHTLTLASALTQNISLCNGAWTAVSANVTQSNPTDRKEGTNSIQFAIAAGFTTGQIAYLTLGGATDFSTEQKFCCWFKASGSLAANTIRIDLCSDALGATAVNSFTINHAVNSGTWYPLMFDNGAALGAAIQSVNIQALLDPGTINLLFDNMLSCNGLTLTSLLTKSSDPELIECYPVKSINGTTVIIDNGINHGAATTGRGYYGTTETVETFKREPIRITTAQTTQEAGTSDTVRITYKGGYNMSDMTSQVGLTFVELVGVNSGWLAINNNFISADRLVGVRSPSSGIAINAANVVLDGCGAVGSGAGIQHAGIAAEIKNCECYMTNSSSIIGSTARRVRVHDCYVAGSLQGAAFDSLTGGANGVNILYERIVAENSGTAFRWEGEVRVYDLEMNDNGAGIQANNNDGIGWIYGVRAIQPSGNLAVVAAKHLLYIHNIDTDGPFSASAGNRLQVSCIGGDPTVSRTYDGATGTICIERDIAVVHGSSSYSMKHTPQSEHLQSDAPLYQRCQPMLVGGGSKTLSVWMRRTHATNIGGRVVIRSGQPGITVEVSSAISAAADTWQEQTLTFDTGLAANEIVPIMVEFESWRSGGTGSVYFGDWSIA